MHTSLNIEEIVSAVFGLLERGDVTSCARVCRTWFPLAIKFIWESVDFYYLVNSVRTSTEKLEKPVKGAHHLSPTCVEWNRLYLYSSHVRHLDITYHTSSRGHLGNPEFLSSLPGDRLLEQHDASRSPLFPLVRSLCCLVAPRSHITISIVLRHLPQLTRLDISFDSTLKVNDIDDFWASFKTICPALVSLRLSIRQRLCEMGKFWSSFGEALLLCDNLEELICGSQDTTMNMAVLRAIVTLPNLRKIEGAFGSTPCFGGRGSVFECTAGVCPRLEELVAYRSHDIASAQGPWLPQNSLRAFTCTDPLTEDGFHDVTRWLSSKQPLIRRLSLCVWSSIHHIHNIGGLHCLQSLSISVLVGGAMITDDDIGVVAAELPHLRVVELFCCSVADPSRLTLQAIHHLITFCPSLYTIMLDFDATLVPATCVSRSASGYPLQARRRHSSLLLLIPPTEPPITDPGAVAGWLSYHCGRYSEVVITKDNKLGLRGDWAEVRRLVNRALSARTGSVDNGMCNQ